jgi:DNA-binding GntR family transcriptional regulator
LAPGDRVLSLERLRFADGAPLAFMHNYLPAALLESWGVRPEDALQTMGLYELLRSHGVHPHAGQQVIGARKATWHEAKLLEVPRNATVLTMTRTTFDKAGQPVEHGSHAYLADRYSFQMSLIASY